MTINTKLLYDDDGFCRLCSLRDEEHTDECPGSILHKLRYEITYSGSNCSHGYRQDTHGSNTGDTLMEAVLATAKDLSECGSYRAEARIIFELSDDAKAMVQAESERIHKERVARNAAQAARAQLRLHTEEFTRSVQALEADRDEFKPEAYARRMRELRDRYRALGVVFSDPVELEVVDEDPMPPRTAEEIEQFRKDEEARGNFAVAPWEAREKAWHERHRKA